MRYQSVPPIDREAAERIFVDGTPEQICETLIRVALHDPDWRWVQSQCLSFLDGPDPALQSVAIICLGHLARIHRTLELDTVVPRLVSLLNDEMLSGSAHDTLDDIAIFIRDAP